MTTFADLGLAEPILKALADQGYTAPTPIQLQAIPPLLAGRDALGLAQTGTGKTAAFACPMLQRLTASGTRPAPRQPRALVLTPTRELAVQIAESFADTGRHLRLRHTVVFGGVGQNPQVQALARGVDILVATPGRLLDLTEQGHVAFDRIEILVLDEADRMLDMGFIRDVRKIVARVPKVRQTLLFSATLPDSVADLASGLLTDPVRVEVAPPATTVERVEQRVLFVDRNDKPDLLGSLLRDPAISRTIVFTRTKHGANRVAERLSRAGIAADAIHGNKSQNARQRALDGFKAGRVRALVATDIAARGIDVDGVTHVINFELPDEPESYVHRIGRTARAGRDGIALSFCDSEEVGNLRDIERTIRSPVPVDAAHPYHSDEVALLHRTGRGGTTKGRGAGQQQGSRGGQGRGGRDGGGHQYGQAPARGGQPGSRGPSGNAPRPFSPPRSPAGGPAGGGSRPAFGASRPAFRSGSR